MALIHISNPINDILNRIQKNIEKNDELIQNIAVEVVKITSKPIELPKIFIEEKEAAIILSVSINKLKELRYQNKAPTHYKIGASIRYHSDDISNYIKSSKK